MPPASLTTIHRHFAGLDDPRVDRTKDHQLLDILTIASCAVIRGADSWTECEAFGQAKLAWLRTSLALPTGIPSHDTFGRVVAALDPVQFQRGFLGWAQASASRLAGLAEPSAPDHVAFDGKALRRSHDRSAGQAALHLVSAWASANRLVLGQVAVDDKSNEITALPVLIKLLDRRDCVATIDAMGCQTALAAAIVEQEGDDVLALKGNRGTLHREVEAVSAHARATGFAGIAHATDRTPEKGPGRIEERRWWPITDPEYLAYLNPTGAWRKRNRVAMVERERTIGETVTRETHSYLASLAEAAAVGRAVRVHWGIENKVHWVLDIAFREDECRVREGHSAQNFAILRHIALNLLRQDRTAKLGIKAKRLKAGRDEPYLCRILGRLNQ